MALLGLTETDDELEEGPPGYKAPGPKPGSPAAIAKEAEKKRAGLREEQLKNMMAFSDAAEADVGRIASSYGQARTALERGTQEGKRAIRSQLGKQVAQATTGRGLRANIGTSLEAAGEAGARIAGFLGSQRGQEAQLAMAQSREMADARAAAIKARMKTTEFERTAGDALSDLRQNQQAINDIVAAYPQKATETDEAYAQRVAGIAAAQGYDYNQAYDAAKLKSAGGVT